MKNREEALKIARNMICTFNSIAIIICVILMVYDNNVKIKSLSDNLIYILAIIINIGSILYCWSSFRGNEKNS